MASVPRGGCCTLENHSPLSSRKRKYLPGLSVFPSLSESTNGRPADQKSAPLASIVGIMMTNGHLHGSFKNVQSPAFLLLLCAGESPVGIKLSFFFVPMWVDVTQNPPIGQPCERTQEISFQTHMREETKSGSEGKRERGKRVDNAGMEKRREPTQRATIGTTRNHKVKPVAKREDEERPNNCGSVGSLWKKKWVLGQLKKKNCSVWVSKFVSGW